MTASAFHVNDSVDCYSRSQKQWVKGFVTEIGEDWVGVTYPALDGSGHAIKRLALDHQQLRRPSDIPRTAASRERRAKSRNMKVPNEAPKYFVGDVVECFSKSQQVWLPAVVKDVVKSLVTVEYSAVQSGAPLQKSIPSAHAHLRRPSAQLPASSLLARDPEPMAESARLFEASKDTCVSSAADSQQSLLVTNDTMEALQDWQARIFMEHGAKTGVPDPCNSRLECFGSTDRLVCGMGQGEAIQTVFGSAANVVTTRAACLRRPVPVVASDASAEFTDSQQTHGQSHGSSEVLTEFASECDSPCSKRHAGVVLQDNSCLKRASQAQAVGREGQCLDRSSSLECAAFAEAMLKTAMQQSDEILEDNARNGVPFSNPLQQVLANCPAFPEGSRVA